MRHSPPYLALLCTSMLLPACSGRPASVEAVHRGQHVDVLPSAADAAPVEATSYGPFPRPAALEPQIGFWRSVYASWRRSQVAVHDDRFLGLVYEVVDLPGDIADQYTEEQKFLIRERREYWQQRLRALEQGLNRSVPPAAEDRALLAKVEQVGPLDQVLPGAADRVRVQRGLRERFKRGLEISGRYEGRFRKIFRQHGLPEEFAYLPHVESSFQAQARSSAGAVGIWQFTRGAAERFMTVNELVDERLDPVASAYGAARYLSYAREQLPNWPLAVTSYNHGIGGMRRARDAVGDDIAQIVRRYDHPKFGFASRNFYTEFLAACEIARQPARFFPEGLHYDPPMDARRAVLSHPMSVVEVAASFDVDRADLIALNTGWNAEVRTGQTNLPAGSTVWLPDERPGRDGPEGVAGWASRYRALGGGDRVDYRY